MKRFYRQTRYLFLLLSMGALWYALPSTSTQATASDIVLYASTASVKVGSFSNLADSSAAGGTSIYNPDAGGAKLANALANPGSYFEMSFNAQAGVPYRLWVRSKADNNSPYNDSFFVQFSGSVTGSGGAVYRIGTTDATTINLEDCSGCGLSGWGWQDNGWGVGVMGPLIYFASTGTQTLRLQPREDGFSIDQIVLSPQTYLNSSPGALKNDTTILPVSGSASNIVIWASDIPTLAGNWSRVNDSTAAGQSTLHNPDNGTAKLANALANPSNYIEVNFNAEANTAYRLWVRSKADNNSPYNDSFFVQFSGSVTGSGGAVYRIGTTDATTINLEDCSGCGLSGWGWQDNGWGVGVMGPVIYFQSTGTQTLRVQAREDGFSIDQIVLSPQTYLNSSPGALKNDTTILASTVGGSTPPPNQPPQVTISASVTSGLAPLTTYFVSNAYDPDGYIASYNWNFGDGQTSTQVSPGHLYSSAGNFTARLTVTDNQGATASATVIITVTNSAPPPPSGVQLRAISWNAQFGNGTDGVYNLDRQATYMASQSPDVIGMYEVEQSSVKNMPQQLTSLMTQKTGVTWNFYWIGKFAGCTEGNLIMTKWQIVSTSFRYLSAQRSVAQLTLNVNGKLVNFFTTHLDPDSSATRSTQVNELKNFLSGFAEPRIVVGDFNAGPDLSEISLMTASYFDSWSEAMNAGTATAYPDNPVVWMTRTRRGRIDYIFSSRGANNVTITSTKIPDLRDLSHLPIQYIGTTDDLGVRPSDHNMMVATFQIN